MIRLILSLLVTLVSASTIIACDSNPLELYDVQIHAEGDEIILEDGDGEKLTIQSDELTFEFDAPAEALEPADALLSLPQTMDTASCWCSHCTCNPNGCICDASGCDCSSQRF